MAITEDAKQGRLAVWRSPTALVLLLLLLTTLLYARTVRYSFISDDYSQIVFNTRIQSWRALPEFFTQHLWAHELAPSQGNYYRPLLLVWMLLNYSLFGANPVGWHATSLLIQLAAGFLVWHTARALTDDNWVAIIAAAIFLLHPLAVESTVEISDANDPLCLCFLLAAFLLFLNRSHRRAWLSTAASVALFALALLTKETAIAFAGVVFVYALLFPPERLRGGALRGAMRACMPYAGVAVLYLMVRHFVIGATVLRARPVVSMTTFFLTLPSVAWTYVRHFFLPTKLAVFYDTPYVLHPEWRQFWLPTLILGCIAGLLVLGWKRTRSRVFVLGLSWTLLLLAPSLYGIAYFGNLGLVHNRYLYLPMAGICISAAVLVAPFLQSKRVAVAAAAILVTLGVLTFQQQSHWKDNEALYSQAVQVAPRSPYPWLALAEVRERQGRTAEAIELADKGLELDPNYFTGLLLRASLAEQVGDTAEAERALVTASAVRPGRPEPHVLLARLRFGQSRDAEGFAEFNKAVELFPNNLDYRLELGRTYLQHNDVPSAIAQYRAAQRIAPAEATLPRFIASLEEQQQRQAQGP